MFSQQNYHSIQPAHYDLHFSPPPPTPNSLNRDSENVHQLHRTKWTDCRQEAGYFRSHNFLYAIIQPE